MLDLWAAKWVYGMVVHSVVELAVLTVEKWAVEWAVLMAEK